MTISKPKSCCPRVSKTLQEIYCKLPKNLQKIYCNVFAIKLKERIYNKHPRREIICKQKFKSKLDKPYLTQPYLTQPNLAQPNLT
jgi:hypothetical protein